MASLFQFLLLKQRCSLCTKVSTSKWRVKQVTTSNFNESLEEIKTHISSSDFVAISMEKTGSSSTTSWHRVLPFDTAETAYLKASHSAQRFQILQFAVCPFSISDSNNLVAHPYNFLLFPRDEFKMGMPAYSFSCQTSHLASMARQGFDFNACIYDGEVLFYLCFCSSLWDSKGMVLNFKVTITIIRNLDLVLLFVFLCRCCFDCVLLIMHSLFLLMQCYL